MSVYLLVCLWGLGCPRTVVLLKPPTEGFGLLCAHLVLHHRHHSHTGCLFPLYPIARFPTSGNCAFDDKFAMVAAVGGAGMLLINEEQGLFALPSSGRFTEEGQALPAACMVSKDAGLWLRKLFNQAGDEGLLSVTVVLHDDSIRAHWASIESLFDPNVSAVLWLLAWPLLCVHALWCVAAPCGDLFLCLVVHHRMVVNSLRCAARCERGFGGRRRGPLWQEIAESST